MLLLRGDGERDRLRELDEDEEGEEEEDVEDDDEEDRRRECPQESQLDLRHLFGGGEMDLDLDRE